MGWATFRFYAELNDFLPRELRGSEVRRRLYGSPAVKDPVEALGVPHTEVDLILVNGESVGFGHRLADGDRVSVYPVFETLDISSQARLRPAPLREPRFVLDAHLGRLARYLRLLGIDAAYRNDFGDEELAQVSAGEHRALLTRDRGLLKRSQVTHGYCLRETDPRLQVREVLRHFHLHGNLRPFHRCLRCNGVLASASPEEVRDQVPAGTLQHYHEFRRCQQCCQVYWQGSHFPRMEAFVEEVAAPW